MTEDGRASRQIELRVIADVHGRSRGSIQSTWQYDVSRPIEMTVSFGDSHDWAVSRNLVADGLAATVGDGDLSFWTARRGVLAMRMSSPDGYALMEMQKKAVREFLAETYKVCARGREVVDVDETIARILKEASRG